MEFDFICTKVLNSDPQGFTILEGNRSSIEFHPFKSQVNYILDKMGFASSKAQKLNNIITTPEKFFNSGHRLYLKSCENIVIGLIKVGYKKLFIRNSQSKLVEISPLCVLDFYVHESQQRNGVGKALFEKMLSAEKIKPYLLGYDRPSDKFINFLAKHYNLKSYVPQNNNFVVFDQYFEHRPVHEEKGRSLNPERKITSAGKNIIDYTGNRIFSSNQNSYKIATNNINTNALNYVSENGCIKKIPFFDNNFFQRNDNPNTIISNVPNKYTKSTFMNVKQSSPINDNSNTNHNNINSSYNNNLLHNFTYRAPISTKRNIFNLDQELDNTLNKLNKLELGNEIKRNDVLHNKRNEFATVFDEKKVENTNKSNNERGFKRNEKSNIFF